MIKTGVTIEVYADHDYSFLASVTEDICDLVYKDTAGNDITIAFASIEEMEAVAKAMLQAAKTVKEA